MVAAEVSPEPTLQPLLPVLAAGVVLVSVPFPVVPVPSSLGATTGGTVGVVPLLVPASAWRLTVPWVPSLPP
jgi:hypothetical protein